MEDLLLYIQLSVHIIVNYSKNFNEELLNQINAMLTNMVSIRIVLVTL